MDLFVQSTELPVISSLQFGPHQPQRSELSHSSRESWAKSFMFRFPNGRGLDLSVENLEGEVFYNIKRYHNCSLTIRFPEDRFTLQPTPGSPVKAVREGRFPSQQFEIPNLFNLVLTNIEGLKPTDLGSLGDPEGTLNFCYFEFEKFVSGVEIGTIGALLNLAAGLCSKQPTAFKDLAPVTQSYLEKLSIRLTSQLYIGNFSGELGTQPQKFISAAELVDASRNVGLTPQELISFLEMASSQIPLGFIQRARESAAESSL